MPTECSAEHFDFGTVEGRAVEAAFDGGLVSSDAGALLLGAPHLARATPMKTAWGWSAKLTRLIVLRDGTRLVTLGDVRAFILKQPEHIQERGSWQHAAELMILAAERGGNIEAATTQIEDALFLEARYVRQ